jgi:DNA-binding MarR family transcriptional regulator
MTKPGSAAKRTAASVAKSPEGTGSKPRRTGQRPKPAGQSPKLASAEQEYRSDVAAYVAAGGDESVQRVITAIYSLAHKLDQWYTRQLVDLDLSAGEWAVLSRLARSNEDTALTPSQLAEATGIAPSSMTHRLDRMALRHLIARAADPDNRTRVLITLADEGWHTFQAAVRESDMVESDVLGPLSRHQREELASLLELLIAGLDKTPKG